MLTVSEVDGGETVLVPKCKCHGVSMRKNGINPSGTQKWRCIIKHKIWDKEYYVLNAPARNYRRYILILRQRMEVKRHRIRQLEGLIAEEVTSGDGEGQNC